MVTTRQHITGLYIDCMVLSGLHDDPIQKMSPENVEGKALAKDHWKTDK